MMEKENEVENAGDDQLHPNWVALSTVKFRPKIFVKSSGTEHDTINQSGISKHRVEIDESSSLVYKEILKMPSTSVKTENKKSKIKRKRVKIEKIEFDRQNLFKLALADDSDGIRRLFECSIQPDVNATDAYGWTALMMSACEGAVDSFQKLLQLGADISTTDKKGNTALTLATKKGFEGIVQVAEDFQRQQELIEISDDEDEIEQGTQFCSDCGIEISKYSSLSHQTSTVHLFSCKFRGKDHKCFGIARTNLGFQMMRRSGWDGNTGLGASQNGKLYPIKTVLRKRGTGLGIEQDPAKITHFKANDPRSIHFRPPQRALTRKEIIENDLKDRRHDQRLRKELS